MRDDPVHSEHLSTDVSIGRDGQTGQQGVWSYLLMPVVTQYRINKTCEVL
jgi:hypothetical protein